VYSQHTVGYIKQQRRPPFPKQLATLNIICLRLAVLGWVSNAMVRHAF
jgi:hypothetical protein